MIFYDTNALLRYYNKINEQFLISSVTLIELENIKTDRRKDETVKSAARKLIRFLTNNEDLYKVIVVDNSVREILSNFGLDASPDNLICACVVKAIDEYKTDIIFYTEDICCREIARSIMGLNINKFEIEDIYKGYRLLQGNTSQIIEYTSSPDDSWNENEYLVGYNIDTDNEFEMRYTNGRFVELKLPNSRFIKGKNALQRCALDALMNNDIPIVAILGGYGSGKTFLTMNMAYYHITKSGNQSKILGVREPVGEGRDIGYLPGDMGQKVDMFFAPLAQQLGDHFQDGIDQLKINGSLEISIPYYMKGTTYNYTVIVSDEAEDLTSKQIKLIGTRLGEGSRIFWSGDYKQSVLNNSEDNALVKMVNELKGNPAFACVYLGEDVRSEASKLYANLFQ